MSSSVTLSSSFLRDRGHEQPGADLLLGVGVDTVVHLGEVLGGHALPGATRVLGELLLHHPALLLHERRRNVERVLLVELLDDLLGEGGLRRDP